LDEKQLKFRYVFGKAVTKLTKSKYNHVFSQLDLDLLRNLLIDDEGNNN